MDCPRCGARTEVYRLGSAASRSCSSCGYVGIAVGHASAAQPAESWDEAIDRYRDRFGPDHVATGRAPEVPEATPSTPAPPVTVSSTAPASDGADADGESTCDRRRAAIDALYETLRSRGDATRAELIESIDMTDLSYASPESFWVSVARDALGDLPGVDPPAPGERVWRFAPAGSERVDSTNG